MDIYSHIAYYNLLLSNSLTHKVFVIICSPSLKNVHSIPFSCAQKCTFMFWTLRLTLNLFNIYHQCHNLFIKNLNVHTFYKSITHKIHSNFTIFPLLTKINIRIKKKMHIFGCPKVFDIPKVQILLFLCI